MQCEEDYLKNEQIVKLLEPYREWFEKGDIRITLRPGDEIRLMSGGGSLGIIPYEWIDEDGDIREWDVVITIEFFLGHPFIVVDEWYDAVISNAIIVEPNSWIEGEVEGRKYRIPTFVKNHEIPEIKNEVKFIYK